MTAPEIEVRIDELVVEGTPAPHGGAAVAEAVHRGLGG